MQTLILTPIGSHGISLFSLKCEISPCIIVCVRDPVSIVAVRSPRSSQRLLELSQP